MDTHEVSILKQLIAIHYEQSKKRKALRILEKQSWSVDFLTMLLTKAAKASGVPLSLMVENKDGQKFVLTADGTKHDAVSDDDIFNHLDNEAAVQSFITQHSRR